MALPEPVERHLAEAPRLFTVRVIGVELIESERPVARVAFGPGEKRPWFTRDFPVIDCPRVGDRWTVELRSEGSPRG